jgi:hypothetical protein
MRWREIVMGVYLVLRGASAQTPLITQVVPNHPLASVIFHNAEFKVGYDPGRDVLFSLDFFHSAGACVTQLSDNTAYSSLLVVNDDDTQVDVLYTKTTHTPITFATTTSNILCMSDMKNLSTVYSIANKMLYLDNLPPHMRRTSPISFQCQSGFAGCVSDGGRFAMTFTAVSHTFPLLYHNCTQLDIDMNGHVVTVVCGATVEYNNAPYPSVVFTDVPMPVLSVVQLEFGCTYDTVLGVMTMWPVLHKQAPVYGDIIITIIAILFLAAWLKWVDGLSAAVKQLYTTIDTQKFALTSNNTLANVQGNIAKHALLIENVLCMIVFTKGLEVLTDHPFFTPFNDPFGLSASSLETHVSVLVGGEVLLCLLALFLLSIIYVRATPRYDRQQPPDYTNRMSWTGTNIAVVVSIVLSITTHSLVGVDIVIAFFGWGTVVICCYGVWAHRFVYRYIIHTLRRYAKSSTVYVLKELVGISWIVLFIVLSSVPVLIPDYLNEGFRNTVSLGAGCAIAVATGSSYVWMVWTSPKDVVAIGRVKAYILAVLVTIIALASLWHVAIFMVAPQLHSTYELSETTSIAFSCTITCQLACISAILAMLPGMRLTPTPVMKRR